MKDNPTISQVFIHPAIGFARVGDSPNEYFLAPEVAGQIKTEKDDFRDSQGRIKRQAVRFRLYGADAKGNVIKELTLADGDIQWEVHVANKKSQWYDFDLAFDIPAAKGEISGYKAVVSELRNKFITGKNRERLIIDPGSISIGGANTNADGSDQQYAFDKGTYYSPCAKNKKGDTPVYLGEVRTDQSGRLIFLGGRGHSASFANLPATTFANNETWHDDTSDGPVDAVIKLKDGRKLKAVGSWVITAPPDYAPSVQAFVTGHDLLVQTAIDMKAKKEPDMPSFFQDIYPILEKLPLNQWVNTTIYIEHGWGSPADLSDPRLIAKLSDPRPSAMPFRQSIFQQFRNPDYEVMQAEFLPPVYGDGVQSFANTDTDPRNFMALLPFQYNLLKLWAEGNFKRDRHVKPKPWNKMTAAEQANSLDIAALEETIGGPFHPGCEYTWPMRQTIMYKTAFRIKRRPNAPINFGPTLDSQKALAKGGPLDGSSPGDITRWMAVPWQTDTSSCLSGYIPMMGQYIPTFWPVRVPNDVLTEDSYQTVMNGSTSLAEKLAAFSHREKWLRGIIYSETNPGQFINNRAVGINKFIKEWSQVGIAVQKDGPKKVKELPSKIWVETGRSLPPPKKSKMSLKAVKTNREASIDIAATYNWMEDRAHDRKKRR